MEWGFTLAPYPVLIGSLCSGKGSSSSSIVSWAGMYAYLHDYFENNCCYPTILYVVCRGIERK